jgi:hypothetical protein
MATDVTVSIETLTLTAITNHQVNEDVIVRPAVTTLTVDIVANPTIGFTPVQGDITIDAGRPVMTLTANNHFIPPNSSWSWNVPTLQDERDTYANVLQWTRPSSSTDEDIVFRSTPGTLSIGNIHNDLENDDLDNWCMLHQRRNEQITSDWRSAWATWYKNTYPTQVVTDDFGFDYDHVFGYGLARYYNQTEDSDALTALNTLAEIVKGEVGGSPPSSTGSVGSGGGRSWARWSLLFTYLAQINPTAANITWRDAFLDRYVGTSSWEETTINGHVRGHYFCNRDWMDQNNQGGTAAYDAGRRSNSVFMYGIHAAAVIRGYMATGRSDLKTKIIRMARFVEHFGHIPSHTVPFTGAYFGHENWDYWHREADNAANCVYDASVVDTLVWGYKVTGDWHLLSRAHEHFRQATRWAEGSPGSSQNSPLVGATEVHKFIDTRPNNNNQSLSVFEDNKGQGFYCYQVFENGGKPALIDSPGGPIETLASNTTSGQWALLTDANTSDLRSKTIYTESGTTRSAFEFCNKIHWNQNSKELHYRGGGASSGGANENVHVRYREATGTWDVVVPYHGSHAHQWAQTTIDPRTGDLWFRPRITQNVLKWTYAAYPATATEWPVDHVGTFDAGALAAQALSFHPEMNNGVGGLVFVETQGDDCSVWTTAADLQTWTKSATNVFGTTTKEEIFSRYLPGQKLVMFGGGNSGPFIGVIDKNKVAYALNNSPVAWGVGDNTKGSVVGHPNGRVFAISSLNNGIWEWNGGLHFNPASPTNDTWTSLGSTPFFSGAGSFRCAATMIPEFDCIYCVVQRDSGANSDLEQWIYKL